MVPTRRSTFSKSFQEICVIFYKLFFMTAPVSADVVSMAYRPSHPLVILGWNGPFSESRCWISSSESSALMVRSTALMDIISPSRTAPMGPPAAASGDTWPIDIPRVAPLNRPSVIRAALIPRPLMAAVGASISCIPGPPFGPS